MTKALEKYNVEVAAITEVRWRAEGADSLARGRWTFVHSAADSKGVGGVGIALTGRVSERCMGSRRKDLDGAWKPNCRDETCEPDRVHDHDRCLCTHRRTPR